MSRLLLTQLKKVRGEFVTSEPPEGTPTSAKHCCFTTSGIRVARESLRRAFGKGRRDKLFAVLEQQVARCTRLEKENERLRKRVKELESGGGDPPQETTQPDQSYSAETVNQRKKRRTKLKKKSGRKPGQDKLSCVARWEDVLPEDASKDDCELQLERPIWRIEDGRATLVGYRVYRRPWQDAPRIPSDGQNSLICWTAWRMKSGNRLTGVAS